MNKPWTREQRDRYNASRKEKYVGERREEILAQRKEWYENNREKILATRMLKRYGILPEDYARMAQEQKGHCPACMRFIGFEQNDLVIDHCHETGQVRVLLCRACNAGEGYLQHIEGFQDYFWNTVKKGLAKLGVNESRIGQIRSDVVDNITGERNEG